MKETLIIVQLDEKGEISVTFPPRENEKVTHAWEIIGLLSTSLELVKNQYLGVKTQ